MKVKFIPQNIELEITPDQSVMKLAHKNGVFIKSTCGGLPSCAECRVRVVEGDQNVLPPSAKEQGLIGTGYFIDQRRLSCQLKCFGDVVIDLTEQVAKQEAGTTRRPQGSKKPETEISHAVAGSLIQQDDLLAKVAEDLGKPGEGRQGGGRNRGGRNRNRGGRGGGGGGDRQAQGGGQRQSQGGQGGQGQRQQQGGGQNRGGGQGGQQQGNRGGQPGGQRQGQSQGGQNRGQQGGGGNPNRGGNQGGNRGGRGGGQGPQGGGQNRGGQSNGNPSRSEIIQKIMN